jgi:hypothetical protein
MPDTGLEHTANTAKNTSLRLPLLGFERISVLSSWHAMRHGVRCAVCFIYAKHPLGYPNAVTRRRAGLDSWLDNGGPRKSCEEHEVELAASLLRIEVRAEE